MQTAKKSTVIATLTAGMLTRTDQDAFLGAAQRFHELTPPELFDLVPTLPEGAVEPTRPTGEGIFDRGLEAEPKLRSSAGSPS